MHNGETFGLSLESHDVYIQLENVWQMYSPEGWEHPSFLNIKLQNGG